MPTGHCSAVQMLCCCVTDRPGALKFIKENCSDKSRLASVTYHVLLRSNVSRSYVSRSASVEALSSPRMSCVRAGLAWKDVGIFLHVLTSGNMQKCCTCTNRRKNRLPRRSTLRPGTFPYILRSAEGHTYSMQLFDVPINRYGKSP